MPAAPHAGGGHRRGRPPGTGKPPGQRTEARSVRLSEDLWAWLEAQPNGPTPTIRRLVEAAKADA